MRPTIALVGRPNVGKSTLFNRLTRSRDALVADCPGLTRDRRYGHARLGDSDFIVIDTGGLSGGEVGIDAATAGQSLRAVDEADVVLLLVDARDGLNPADEHLVKRLRQRGRDFHLAVNKIDGMDAEIACSEFHALGAASLHAIAAAQGRGVGQMIDAVLAPFPPGEDSAAGASAHEATRVAVVGRPNAGKSTLVNRILGEERVVVYDRPGTTRDSVYIDFERNGRAYTLIDTAGIRRRKNVRETVEKFSIVKTLKAIDDANVVLLLIDAGEGLVDQDLHLLGHCAAAGRARVRAELDRRLRFADYADTHFISARHGSGVGKLFASIDAACAAAMRALGAGRLTRILQDAVAAQAPPRVHGRRIKLRYAHAGGRNPPRVVVHGTRIEGVPESYRRYLEKVFARALELSGTPLRVEFRAGDNPYAGRRNELTRRQIERKRRLMAHVKQVKKHRQQRKQRPARERRA